MKQQKMSFIDDRFRYIGKGILTGLIAGIVVSSFRIGIQKILNLVIRLYHFSHTEPQWLILWAVFSVMIAVIIGSLVKSEPNIKGSGIPQVEGQVQGVIQTNWRSVLWRKFIGGLLANGSGLFLGREGPSIQLGSAIGQGVSEWTKGDEVEESVLLSSGAGAGLAAAFNAPIAGLMFVLEEVHHNFSPLVAITTFAATISSNFVALNIFGLTPVLDIGSLVSFPLRYYNWVVLLGIFLGFSGWFFSKTLLALPGLYAKVPLIPKRYNVVIPLLLIIPIGYFLPEMIGGGSSIITNLENWQFPLGLLAALFVLRFVFFMVSYGSNVPGGIFLPILSLGGILGCFVGQIAITYFGVEQIFFTHFIIFAMAGYFTSIGKAPLTAILLVTEMVGGLNQLMPLAIVSLVSYVTSDLLNVKPIYEQLLDRLIASNHGKRIGKRFSFVLPVVPGSAFTGKAIKDINWPEDILITGVRRGQDTIIPCGKTMIRTGDHLILSTDKGLAKEVHEQLNRLNTNTIGST